MTSYRPCNTLRPYDELESYGIRILTGESCALSMRLLCSMTEKAMQSYLSFTGIQVDFEHVQKEWGDNNLYHVYLTRSVIQDLIIFMFIQDNPSSAVIEVLPNKINNPQAESFLMTGNFEAMIEYIQSEPCLFSYTDYSSDDTKTWIKQDRLYDIGRSYHIYQNQPHSNNLSNVSAFMGTAHN